MSDLPKASHYADGRPAAHQTLPATDEGVVFPYGQGPGNCDHLGAREAIVYKEDGLYHLYYDGAGPKGWLACLATSTDLINWERHGPILDLGEPGSPDSATATAPWLCKHDGWWHMFYLGSPNASPAPNYVPSFPYLTCKARSRNLKGPWTKEYETTPFRCVPGTHYSITASPGFVIKHDEEFLQYFSCSSLKDHDGDFRGDDVTNIPHDKVTRTLGLATTRDLNNAWQVHPEPILPIEEQIENSSLYFDSRTTTWYLFTNHIGIGLDDKTGKLTEYTDAIWVYWSQDPYKWDPKDKAVVMDGESCSWSKRCIGMPTVIPHDGRLALLYDAPGQNSIDHMKRSIGLAWLDLPLTIK